MELDTAIATSPESNVARGGNSRSEEEGTLMSQIGRIEWVFSRMVFCALPTLLSVVLPLGCSLNRNPECGVSAEKRVLVAGGDSWRGHAGNLRISPGFRNVGVLLRGGATGDRFVLMRGPEIVSQKIGEFSLSPDGRVAAAAVNDGQGWYVAIVGERQAKLGPFEDVAWLQISPGSLLASFVGSRSGHRIAVVREKENDKYEAVDQLVLGPEPDAVAFGARRQNKWVVCSGLGEGQDFDQVRLRSDWGTVAYVARIAEKRLIVVNGRVDSIHELCGSPAVSLSGNHVAYCALLAGKLTMVLDQREVATLRLEDGLSSDPECAVSDSGTWACHFRDGGRWAVRQAKGTGESFDRVWDLSASGSVVAYAAERGNRCFLIVDGRISEQSYDLVSGVGLFDDGQCCVARGARGGQEYLLLNDKEIGPYDEVLGFDQCTEPDHIHAVVRKGEKIEIIRLVK